MNTGISAINEAVQAAAGFVRPLFGELGKVIIGQTYLVERLVVGLLANGHVLLEGVPGLAKTLSVKSLANCLHVKFSRLQFTPDMLPADVVGTQIYNPQSGMFTTRKGPIFANLVLADEINRAPAKVQSALLEAMQERQVTIGDQTFRLDEPFLVLATQNPIEQEGTYPLPEAQLDRFMFFINVEYPSQAEEGRIARETTGAAPPALSKLIGGEQIMGFQEVVQRVPAPDHIFDAAVELARKSRPRTEHAPEWINRWVSWGAGPRAVQYLIRGSKARAVLHGSYLVRMEDLEAVARPVLRHRILTNFQAQAEGVDSNEIIRRLLEELHGEASRA